MRIAGTILTALLAAASLAGPAAAAPGSSALFVEFDTVCVANQGDRPATEAAARAKGYRPLENPEAGSTTLAMERTVDGRRMVIIIDQSLDDTVKDLPPTDIVICGVGVGEADTAALEDGRRWIGMPVTVEVAPTKVYVYRQGKTKRTALDYNDKAAMSSAILATEYALFSLREEPGFTMITLARSRPIPRP